MRKTWERLACLALVILLCLGGSVAFSDGTGQLTVKIGKDDSPFRRDGIRVELFRVSAEAAGADRSMLPAFSSVKLPAENTAQQTDAALDAIRKIIREKSLSPSAAGTTDKKGQAAFRNLQSGVYFGRVTNGPEDLEVQDFLVSVPQKQEGIWTYTAEAELKYEYVTPSPTPEPTPAPTPEPPPGKPASTPKPYHLVIHYTFWDTGETAWPDHNETLRKGENYDVLSPMFPDYWYDLAEVAGTMPAHDMEYTVFYFTKKPGWSYYTIEDYEAALGIGTIQMHVGVCFE